MAEGGLRKQIAIWQERAARRCRPQAERAIDYDEEDEAVDPALLGGLRRTGGRTARVARRGRASSR